MSDQTWSEMDQIRERLRRLYAAIDETTESDLSRVPAAIAETEHATFFIQDFSGGLAPEKISNLAHTAISLLAHLRDHLRRLAKTLARDPEEIDQLVGSSLPIQVLIDLSNRDKHGPPRDGGCSGRSPELKGITRPLCLSPGRTPGGAIQVQYTSTGPQTRGTGSASVIITGDIMASDGSCIGDLHSFLLKALEAWEKLVKEWLPPGGHAP